MQERQLLAQCEVLAVEPVNGMVQKFNELASKNGVQVQCAIGSADDLQLPERSVDVVIAAQAFHWFSTPAALEAISAVLRPNGVFVWCWNGRQKGSPVAQKCSAVMSKFYHDDYPRHSTGKWKAVFDDQPYFQMPYHSWHAANTTQTMGGEQMVIDRVISTSIIASLPAHEQQRVIDELKQLLHNDPQTAEQADYHQLVIPYDSEVHYALVSKQ